MGAQRKKQPQTAFGRWLQSQREARGWSLRDLAARSGLSHSYLRDLEYGVDRKTGNPWRPTVDALAAIAAGLGLPVEEVLSTYLGTQIFHFGKDVGPEARIPTIPVYEAVTAIDPDLRYTKPVGWTPLETLPQGVSPSLYFGVVAPDDTMALGPTPIRKGWLCIVRRGPVDDGRVALLILPGEEQAILRQVRKQGRNLLVSAFDPSVEPKIVPAAHVHVIGEVVEVRFRPLGEGRWLDGAPATP